MPTSRRRKATGSRKNRANSPPRRVRRLSDNGLRAEIRHERCGEFGPGILRQFRATTWTHEAQLGVTPEMPYPQLSLNFEGKEKASCDSKQPSPTIAAPQSCSSPAGRGHRASSGSDALQSRRPRRPATRQARTKIRPSWSAAVPRTLKRRISHREPFSQYRREARREQRATSRLDHEEARRRRTRNWPRSRCGPRARLAMLSASRHVAGVRADRDS